MQNGIFRTDWAAVGEAVITAVVVAVLGAFTQIVLSGNFDVLAANWASIGHTMLNVGFVAGVASLAKDFLSTNGGSLLNLTPSNTAPAQQ